MGMNIWGSSECSLLFAAIENFAFMYDPEITGGSVSRMQIITITR